MENLTDSEGRPYAWHQRISIRLAFALTSVGISVGIFLLSAVVAYGVNVAHIRVVEKYDATFQIVMEKADEKNGAAAKVLPADLSGLEGVLYDTHQVLIVLGAAAVTVGMALCGSALFYRWKLQEPVEMLSAASARLAQNDLNIPVTANSGDELGRLCSSFEAMRTALIESNQALWRAAEESQRVNAAFAHDLRTPLTVLQGYGEFLEDGLAAGQVSMEKVQETMAFMNRQVARLSTYTESMYGIKQVDERVVVKAASSLKALAEELRATGEILLTGIDMVFEPVTLDHSIAVDSSVVTEVFENLMANALRYARKEIRVRLSLKGKSLAVTVRDDGPGFHQQALRRGEEPYFRGKEDGKHFGLGLYLSSVLCKKHGGKLVVSNAQTGGGEVLAVFSAE